MKKIEKYIIIVFIVILIINLQISKIYAYEISKSNKATDLDENYESLITISTPINDGNNFYDFVFVLDKSTSGKDEIRNAIDEFSEKLKNNNKNIKVGVVAFYNKAEIIKNFDEDEMKTVSGSGTNMSAGILLAIKMLDDDTSVLNSHKYLIIISDGDTHIFNKNNIIDGEPTVIAQGKEASNTNKIAGPDSYKNKYSNFDPPSDWNAYFEDIAEMVKQDRDAYENPWNTKGNNKYNDSENYIPYDEIANHAVSVDKALYYSYLDYLVAKEKGYKTFTVPIESSYGRNYGPSFMKFLNDGNDIEIDSLIDITYMVGPGTTITNYIGKGTTEQGIDYDFDVVNDINNYTIKVNGKEKDITQIETIEGATSTYGAVANSDGSYDYIINYYEGEYEKIEIVYNVIVSNLEPIEVGFKIKLNNPTDVSGNYTGLETNNNCVIKIIDSKGNFVGEELFEVPKLNYTIKPKEDVPPLTDIPSNDNPNSNESQTINNNENEELLQTENEKKNKINVIKRLNTPETGDKIGYVIVLLVLAIITFIGTIIIEKKIKRKPKH